MNPTPGILWDDLPSLRARAADLLTGGPQSSYSLAGRLFGLKRGPPALVDHLVREVLHPDPRFDVQQDAWVLRDGGGADERTPLRELDFVVVDVEATGGSPARGHRVTELAAVRVRDGVIVEEFESLINPRRPIPRAITALTNITHDMVATAPPFAELADAVRERLVGAVFVAHNADFDWRFLRAEFARCRGIRLRGPRICTLRLARRLHPELPRRSLPALAHYYDISCDRWHRAGPDARATAALFCRFLDRLEGEGVSDWGAFRRFVQAGRDDRGGRGHRGGRGESGRRGDGDGRGDGGGRGRRGPQRRRRG